MPMAAFVTQLRHQQRERDVKNELMSVVNNNKTAASRQNFASFSFPLFQLNILIKLWPKQKMLQFYFLKKHNNIL